eukprot:scaffold114449_cov72-Phaeocystis_antarctica.AAC.5
MSHRPSMRSAARRKAWHSCDRRELSSRTEVKAGARPAVRKRAVPRCRSSSALRWVRPKSRHAATAAASRARSTRCRACDATALAAPRAARHATQLRSAAHSCGCIIDAPTRPSAALAALVAAASSLSSAHLAIARPVAIPRIRITARVASCCAAAAAAAITRQWPSAATSSRDTSRRHSLRAPARAATASRQLRSAAATSLCVMSPAHRRAALSSCDRAAAAARQCA